MKKGDVINGYRILSDFTVAGAGLSKWTFAQKGDEEFFFKEFLAPTYPTDGSPGSPKTKAAKRQRCTAFETHQKSVIALLKDKCACGGNVVFARDFFRAGAKYYKVTDKVDVASLGVEDIARLPLDSRVLIMKTVAHSLGVLHGCNIVHGDLKPNNLLIKRSAHGGDTYIAKLIDFDSSYFAGKPPEVAEELVGDLVFYSPEAVRYVREDSSISPGDLQLASDIFALGVIYCLYLTGKLPLFDQEKFQYPCLAVINGKRVQIRSEGVLPFLAEIVNEMLQAEISARPTVAQVFQRLKTLDKLPSSKPSAAPAASGGSLRGSLLKKSGTAAPASSLPSATAPTAPAKERTPGTGAHVPAAKADPGEAPGGSKLRGKLLKRDGA